MNKQEFIDYISVRNKCTKIEVERIINIFTESVIGALAEKKEVNLIGFGSFYATHVEEKEGRNPQTGQSLKIAAHYQAKFKAGQKLKDACNSKQK